MAHFSYSRVIPLLAFIVTFALFIPFALAESTPSGNEQIRIYPTTPLFSEPFFVTASGQWANSCVPVFQRVEVGDYTIRLEARTPGPLVFCVTEPTDWGFAVIIPPQPPSLREAELVVFSGITGETLSILRHKFDVQGGMQVLPPLPLVNETFTLRLADLSPDGCVPAYVSHAVISQTLTIEAQIPDVACGQTPAPWQMDVSPGPLAMGNYQTELFVTDYRHTPPQRSRLLEDSFVVVGQILRTYLPLWGCFGREPSPLSCTIVPFPEDGREKP